MQAGHNAVKLPCVRASPLRFQNTVCRAYTSIITRIQLYTDTILVISNTVASIALSIRYLGGTALRNTEISETGVCFFFARRTRRFRRRFISARFGCSAPSLRRALPGEVYAASRRLLFATAAAAASSCFSLAACALRLGTRALPFQAALRACSTCCSSSSPHGLPSASTRRCASGLTPVQVTPV